MGILVSVAIYFLITLGCVIVALRGSRIPVKARCRDCRFELTGLPEPFQRCPECGADLGRRRAVVRPTRKRSPALVAGALTLFATGLLVLVMLGAPFFRRGVATMDTVKPVWLLLAQSDGAAGASAREELVRRALHPRASDALLRRLANRALDVQGDREREWSSAWATLLGLANDRGLLSEDQLRRYREQALELEAVEPWSPTTAGLSTAFRVRLEARLMESPDARTYVMIELVRFRAEIERQTLADYKPTGLAGAGGSGGVLRSEFIMVAPSPVEAAPGTRTARITLLAALGEQLSIRERTVIPRDKFGRPLSTVLPEEQWMASIERTVERAIEVLPASTSDVEFVKDSAIDEKMRKAISSVWVTSSAPDAEDGSTRLVSSSQIIRDAPLQAIFRVMYRSAGRAWAASQPVTTQNGSVCLIQTDRLRAFPSDRVDVVLVPAERESILRAWTRKIYGGELVFKDVPVRESAP